jgi:hypothetical protein
MGNPCKNQWGDVMHQPLNTSVMHSCSKTSHSPSTNYNDFELIHMLRIRKQKLSLVRILIRTFAHHD